MLLLYTTAGCHLCEHAEEILYAEQLSFQPIDIADDLQLIERYGVRIPVLSDSAGNELGWPFDGSAVRQFLASA